MCLDRRKNGCGDVPKTEAEKRAANERYHQWRFPVQHELEQLRRQLVFIRGEAAQLQKRGFARDAFNLNYDAAKIVGRIEELENSLDTQPS